MSFQVGDRVERITSVDGVPEYPVGAQGIVTSVDIDRHGVPWSVNVRFDGYISVWGCFPDSLRVISTESEEPNLSGLDLTEIL